MKKLILGTLVALAASAILAAPGGAAKPAYALSCTPTTIRVSWTSNTAGYFGAVFTSSGGEVRFQAPIGSLGNSPGVTSFATPAGAVTAMVTFVSRRDNSRTTLDDFDCTQ